MNGRRAIVRECAALLGIIGDGQLNVRPDDSEAVLEGQIVTLPQGRLELMPTKTRSMANQRPPPHRLGFFLCNLESMSGRPIQYTDGAGQGSRLVFEPPPFRVVIDEVIGASTS